MNSKKATIGLNY